MLIPLGFFSGASVPASTSTTMVPAATAARSLCSAWDVTLGGRGDFFPCKGGATSPVTSGGTWGLTINGLKYMGNWGEKTLLIGVLTLFITGRGPTLWDF